jgi:hypothetical protein
MGIWLFSPDAPPGPVKADLIMIFPGGPERIATGFQLAKAGYAAKLAISNAGLKGLEANATHFGAPAAVTFVASSRSRSTFEDVFNTREIVRQHNVRSLLLVTSAWHIPRSYFLLRCFLAWTGVTVQVIPVEDLRAATGDWNAAVFQVKVAINEGIKCWGSSAELVWSLLTDRLLLDIPLVQKISTAIKQKVLFSDLQTSPE